jgi:hypothetical protein
MRGLCRKPQVSSWQRRQPVLSALRHARIVTDPKLLARLNAEIKKRKLSFPDSPSTILDQ